jgi:hypothetical protein
LIQQGEALAPSRWRVGQCYSSVNGGGIPLEYCTVTDDGVRCTIEYNCVRWQVTDIPS